MRILVIGEGCKDVFQYGSCDRLAPEAPAPVFVPDHIKENQGMALNVKNNLLSLGVDAEICTNLNWPEITKTRFVDTKSNHMIMRLDKNDRSYGRINMKNINFSLYDAIIISDYNKGFLSEDDILHISTAHPLTFLDTKKTLGKWCKNIKFIKINNFEFKRTKELVTKKIMDKLIITLGSEGAMYNGIVYPVPEVDIKDLSGAGDTFVAALSYMYVKTKDISEAIKFANICATNVVQHKGVGVVNDKK